MRRCRGPVVTRPVDTPGRKGLKSLLLHVDSIVILPWSFAIATPRVLVVSSRPPGSLGPDAEVVDRPGDGVKIYEVRMWDASFVPPGVI